MPEEKRMYTPRETRLINEWVKSNFPDKPQWRKVRVGPIPGTPEDIIYKGLRRWVDYIVWDGTSIILIEAKIRPQGEGIAELEMYKKLFPRTPEFKFYWDRPIRMIYVTTRYDEIVASLCAEKGIEFIVYSPEWMEEYWRELMTKP